VDENTLDAFYLGSASHRTDCIDNPYGTQFKCPLGDFKKDGDGIPTLKYKVFNDFNKGDILLTESDSAEKSDVIRFAVGKLQFFSDPGDGTKNDPRGVNDVAKLPTTTADDKHTFKEVDLSNLDIALSNDSQHSLKLADFLKGKVGTFYFAAKGDIGGSVGAPNGIGYVFVSDGDTPEPRMMAPLGCIVFCGFLVLRWRRNRSSDCGTT
jgi:hypothetical protein